MMEEITVKSLFSKHFGMSAIALAILAASFIGRVDEGRILGIEKEIVELRVETKTEIAGLKEDIKRIDANLLRLESKIDAFIASQATGGRADG